MVKAWGDGTTVAADGTQVETYIDNLLAETSIRYGTGVRTGSRVLSAYLPGHGSMINGDALS